MTNRLINSFDIDGVINMGRYDGIYPGPNDIIITGRSKFDEYDETVELLNSKGIHNELFMNPVKFEDKTRTSSGRHKGMTLFHLESAGYRFGIHFDDDPIQIKEIKKIMPHIHCVLIQHDLVEKENVRHVNDIRV